MYLACGRQGPDKQRSRRCEFRRDGPDLGSCSNVASNRFRADDEETVLSCTRGPQLRGWSKDESRKCFAIREQVGGREGIRTPDPLLAKQVLSQLSYTPTVRVTFILKHFSRFQNPFPRVLGQTVLKLFQTHSFRNWLSFANRHFIG